MSAAVPLPGRSLAEEAAALGPWFHNLHLPGGVQTAPDHWLGGDFPAFKWRQIGAHVPEDLSGWSVLDIGCNAGYYSFELARRGAEVTAIDLDPHYLRQARWAAGVLGLAGRVTFRQMQVHELAREQQRYDLVWFMGVLYHLRHPLLALDIVRQKTRRMLVLQTLSAPGADPQSVPEDIPLEERGRLLDPGWPRMYFLERRMAGDPTNWWAPDQACVEAMLRSSGFAVERSIAPETWLCTPAAAEDPAIAGVIEAELRAATGSPLLD
jgi:tRNA (mo5U34)-methyltransferase